jgi:TfoX/Sxy family transcriptional regulator of competence genes
VAFDKKVVDRVRRFLESKGDVTERKMFGGVAFMVRGNMICAVGKDHLMVRVGSAEYEAALRMPHAHEMRFTGRPMRGYVTVDPAGYETSKGLSDWLQKAVFFVCTLPPK